jgi:hypothetical protein
MNFRLVQYQKEQQIMNLFLKVIIMGIIDKILNGGENDDSDDKLVDRDDFGKSDINNLGGKNKWPYSVDEDASERVIYDGDEIQHIIKHPGEEDDEYWAGETVREMMESHMVRADENSWIGYTRDRIKGFNQCGIQKNSLFRHIAFFGQTGYGKSTALTNLMTQWAFAGHGMCFIDPKGEDSKELLQKIPEDRLDDVVWVEPGNPKRDRVVGFNFLDTMTNPGEDGFENEVAGIVTDLVDVVRAGKTGWGATMDTVSKAIARPLIRAEEDYTILDMYKILVDEDERELFTDIFGEGAENEYMKRIKEMDNDEFDPLIRRFEEWIGNQVTKELVAHRQSKVNIANCVKEGKILIVRNSELPSEDLKSLVSTAIMRRIWSAITSREKKNREPFFLVADEFDKVSRGEMNIGDMLSMARSFKLSICLANQYPSQLDDDVKRAIYSNVENLFTFKISNDKDARDIAKPFEIDKSAIFNLDKYEIIGRLSVDGETTDALKISTFAPYPPRRSEDEIEDVIGRKLNEQGVPKLDGDEAYGVLAPKGVKEEDGEERFIDESSGEEITEEQVLACVHTGGIRGGTREIDGKEGWVSKEDVVEEMKNYVGESYESILSNAIEKIPEAKLKTCTADGGKVFMRLTSEGEETVFVQDTGSGGSSGKIGHKEMLKKAYKEFTKLGYNVTLPKQIGEDQPDGRAEPPIKPVENSETFEEAKELREKAEREYPRLYNIFGDEELHLEAESTTVKGKPKQTIKNLVKGVEKGKKTVFLVPEGENEFERWGRKCEDIFKKPPFVREIDENSNRWFYTESSKLKLDDGYYALQKGDGKSTVWKEKEEDGSTKIILEDPDDGSVIARFDDISDIDNPSRRKFPFNYKYDRGRKKVIVRDNQGNEVDTFSDTDEFAKEGNYTNIREPQIPEKIFPGGTHPKESSWEIVIMPDKDSDYDEPQIYQSGKLTPLHSGEKDSKEEDKEDNEKDEEENLNKAAMEGFMENEGNPPDFKDNRDTEEEEDDEEEQEDRNLDFPDKNF